MKYLLSSIILISFFLPLKKYQIDLKPNKIQIQQKRDTEKLREKIDSILTSKYEKGKLNGNVLVVHKGNELFKKSYGFADADKNQKLNENFRFNIGSIYKEFPAVAIMQLKEKGALTLHDKLSKYVRDLPNWSDNISIIELLQYSSGLPKVNWGGHFSNGEMVTDQIIFNDLKAIETLEFSPGTDYLYSNYNPILLIKIVEEITQQNFTEYAQENLFNPYSLNSSKISDQFPYKDKTLMAIPFDENYEIDNYKISMPTVLFSSTVQDMYKWFKHLDSFDIISKESVKILSKEAKIGHNIQAPLGRFDWNDDLAIEHLHHGSSGNYECVVRRFKQKDLTIVILTNQKHGNVNEISQEIFELF
ncbi:CubicO group peptidase, beta-lactamase class C family [Zunongwangia mangrovi]|uniref:CubicO group peptidase, beta-lactamase class C family n=1 Tax=Zunongwangia mangrovi TaxID=1334022 RepID=A0A1I1NCM6_9FLAO|nr:serine hydrolase domain-containing protein [Zunongwangia mangrovi]SFC95474.1 CubicO group peptidase, beta-lactamase class C family [Zunongwangia mangrovi]